MKNRYHASISAWKIVKAGQFDADYYRAKNPVLRRWSRWGAAAHYVMWGGREGRNPGPSLFLPYFRHLHPESRPAGGFELRHFLALRQARRDWPNAARVLPLLYDFEAQLQTVEQSGLLDAEYYLESHRDVRLLPEDALAHYCWTGWREGFNPHPLLSHATLTALMPAPWRGQINPLIYYLRALPDRDRREAWSRAIARFQGTCALHALLANGVRWDFRCAEKPRLSVIMVVRNQAEWTALSLRSLLAERDERTELILVDNGSTDETPALCERLLGVTLHRVEENLGYGAACNWGVRQARGDRILFLNNDLILQPGALTAAAAALESAPDIGAVGGRLIHFSGTLQEAGGVLWRSGFCAAYGRGDYPIRSPFETRRFVDYGSAAFLLVRADVLQACGPFDPAFNPAYFEDVDLCVRIQKAGWRIVYEPRAICQHAEYGSSSSSEAAIALMEKHHQLLVDRHAGWLQRAPEPNPLTRRIRSANRTAPRVLVLDIEVPFPRRGRGLPHTHAVCQALVELGWDTTYFSLDRQAEPWSAIHQEIHPGIEVVHEYGGHRLDIFLHRFHGEFDALILVRPGTMLALNDLRERHPDWFAGMALVYDAEALFAARNRMENRLIGRPDAERRYLEDLAQEVQLAKAADVVWTVSAREQVIMRDQGVARVHVVRHAEKIEPGPAPFAERSGFLFVGMLDTKKNPPNADAVAWFLKEIWPRIRARLGDGVEFYHGGTITGDLLSALPGGGWRALGNVADLEPVYNQCRVFIAPTRFSAGIPLKVCSAAARGVPCVVSAHLADQLGWRRDEEVLTAPTGDAEAFAEACVRLHTDEKLWQSIRERALVRMQAEFSPDAFRESIRQSLASVVNTSRAG